MEVLEELRKLLLPVFGMEDISEVNPEYSLVNDIGADSLDFVEIIHLIEKNFGIVVTTNSLMAGGKNYKTEELFDEGLLTENGEKLLKDSFQSREEQIKKGMSKIDLFSLLTVEDLAQIIKEKINELDRVC